MLLISERRRSPTERWRTFEVVHVVEEKELAVVRRLQIVPLPTPGGPMRLVVIRCGETGR